MPERTNPNQPLLHFYHLKIDEGFTASRTIGIALDSIGTLIGYTENTVGIVGAGQSEVQSIVATFFRSRLMFAFSHKVRMPLPGDTTKDADVTQSTIDSTHKPAMVKVAEWVRSRCAPKP